MSNGAFAFGAFLDGLVVIDRHGKQLFRYDGKIADASVLVLGLFQDRAGILWVCLNDGILKIEYPSPFSYFDKQLGINSWVQIMKRYGDVMLAGTANGLYSLKKDSLLQMYSYKLVQDFSSRIWDISIFDDLLLIADEDAVYEYDGMHSKKIGDFNASAFLRSSVDPNRVFISLAKGLRSIYYERGKWVDEGKIDGVLGSTYTIVEEPSGNLWLETSEDWIWKVSFASKTAAKNLTNPVPQKFTAEQGLPGTRGNLFMFKNSVYFASENQKTYRHNKNTGAFELAVDLNEKLGLVHIDIIVNHVDEQNNLWFATFDNNIQSRWVAFDNNNDSGNKNLEQARILNDLGGSETLFYDKRDTVLWLTGNNSVIKHNLKLNAENETSYSALVNKVVYQKDSVLRYSAYSDTLLSLTYPNNSFRFQYSATSHQDESKNQFQYILDGFDTKWSTWSRETQKDYTNIPEGDYTFRVRAKNILGQIGEEGEYEFRILPPWYRTWWAYVLYALGAAGLIWAFSHWRSKQLRQKNLVLEAVVTERTEEIRKKNKMLSYQTERLKELDMMKTRLFANISHEFRTPLTLIKGPVEKLEREQNTRISMPNIKMIRRNANRLLNLVNQLLDLSKLDSGKLSLNPAEGDLFKSIRAAASAFSSHAASRNMDYRVSVPSEALWVSFDRDKLEKILYNLLSNAFKFTADEGSVHVQAEFRNNKLKLKVKDSGSGIPEDKLPHIFDRFYQVDDSYTREKTGSGIGLALTKELVELMRGTIFVESDPGQETVFRVVIPMEKIETTRGRSFEEEVEITPEAVLLESGKTTDTTKGTVPVVLIIEDNNDMRFFIREQLEGDYNIFEAEHGEQGLEKAETVAPDLIVTDLMMPRMDGITLCQKLKTQRSTSHIPVIMLTAKAGLENKLEGLETGADDYLTKPFDARELQIRVRNLIDQRAKLRALYSKNISLDPKEIAVNSVDEEFLEEVLALMEEHYENSTFGPKQLQQYLAMSKTQLHRKLKALTDTPPSELLRNFRLKRAAQLLPQRGDNISQVAYDVGFNTLSYFTKCFKDLYGVSPTQYVKNQKPS